MYSIKSLVWLSILCIAAEGLAYFLPLPSGILGMLLLLTLLLTKTLPVDTIRQPADALLSNMALLFVPSGVQIVQNLAMSASTLLKFLLICLIATFCTFYACAKTVQLVLRLTEGRKKVLDV